MSIFDEARQHGDLVAAQYVVDAVKAAVAAAVAPVEADRTAVLVENARLEADNTRLTVERDAALKALADHMATHVQPHRVAYGSNPFGWAKRGETQEAAWTRITAASGFGPQKTVRLWPQGDVSSLSWAQVFPDRYRTVKRAVINIGSGKAHVEAYASGSRNAALERLCSTAPAGYDIVLTVGHEPENDGIDPATWAKAQNVVAGIARAHGLGVAPLLMGTTYDPKRVSWSGGILWDRWWAGIDRPLVTHVGADVYQMGTAAKGFDTAETALHPPLEAAKTLGLPLIVGELGARKVELIGDTGRAKFLTDCIRICDNAETSHSIKVTDVHYFETDNGAADRVPWNLIDNASPQAVAVWRAACAR